MRAVIQKIMAHGVQSSNRYIPRLIVYLAILLGFYSVSYIFGLTATNDPINWIGPIALIVGCLFTGYRMVRLDPNQIWLPYPWFLAASVLFIGVGPLLFNFGNPESIFHAQRAWIIYDEDLFLVNLLNTIGVLLVSCSFYICNRIYPAKRSQISGYGPSNISHKKVAIVLTAIGVFVKYVLVLPYEFGMTDFVLPGMLYSLGSLMKVVLFVLGYVAIRYRGPWPYLLIILTLLELGTDFLRFSKEELLLTMVMPFLGVYYYSRKKKILIYAAVSLILVYPLYNPIVLWGRVEVTNISGTFWQASLTERMNVVANGFVNHDVSEYGNTDSIQRWWLRLNFATEQAYVMSQYDNAVPGDTLGYMFYTLIPRFIWQDKPIMTNNGVKFTKLYFGHEGGATGIGIFGEAYWNGGWVLVFVVSLALGVMFKIICATTLPYLIRKEFVFLPAAFIGVKIGVSITSWIVTSYVGLFVIYLGYYFLINVTIARRQSG